MRKRFYRPLEDRIKILISSTYLAIPLVLTLANISPQLFTTKKFDLLLSASYIFLGINVVEHLIVTLWPKAKKIILDFLIIVDVTYVALVIYLSGGTTSPFIFLFYVQIVAITLSISYRTGLKVVILQTILFLSVYYQQYSGQVNRLVSNYLKIEIVGSHFIWHFKTILNVAFLWTIAAITTFFSSINESELKQSNKELAILNKAGLEIEKNSNLHSVLKVIIKAVIKELGFNSVFISLIDSKKKVFGKGISVGFDDAQKKELQKIKHYAKGSPIIAKALKIKQPIGGRIRGLDKSDQLLEKILVKQKEFIVIPLVGLERTVGIMIAAKKGFGTRSRIKNREVDVLSTLAKQSAVAIDNAILKKKLQKMASTDSLTGLYNRGHFQKILQFEIEKIKRYKNLSFSNNPLSIILADVDNFKQFNDQFGHPEGDALLEKIAAIFIKNCRSRDVACRYGGEEFVLILPDTGLNQSKIIADRLRKSVLEIKTAKQLPGRKPIISLSLGIMTANKNEEYAPSILIKKADQALYDAKAKGKDCLVHYLDFKKTSPANLKAVNK